MLRRRGVVTVTASALAAADAVVVSVRRGALTQCGRGLRNIVPPRPEVTTLVYLDHSGRVMRSGCETDVSFVRLRNNTFYLQRLLPSGEVIRWAVPGLAFLKHSTNFENNSLGDIDFYGGIAVPMSVCTDGAYQEYYLSEVIELLCQCTPDTKLTRRQRRDEHRVSVAHWCETPDEMATTIGVIVFFVVMATVYIGVRWYYSVRNHKSFWDAHLYDNDYDFLNNNSVDDFAKASLIQRLMRFQHAHPEHHETAPDTVALSPGQRNIAHARGELHEVETIDPHFRNELWWRVQHLYYYGHWPKSLAA